MTCTFGVKSTGKLTADQIKAGYKALKKIDTCIEKKDFGSALNNACDEFYTRIPHDFGQVLLKYYLIFIEDLLGFHKFEAFTHSLS